MWVTNLRSGKPVLEFTTALKALLDSRGIGHAHVSITDERGLASATVILETSA